MRGLAITTPIATTAITATPVSTRVAGVATRTATATAKTACIAATPTATLALILPLPGECIGTDITK